MSIETGAFIANLGTRVYENEDRETVTTRAALFYTTDDNLFALRLFTETEKDCRGVSSKSTQTMLLSRAMLEHLVRVFPLPAEIVEIKTPASMDVDTVAKLIAAAVKAAVKEA